MKRRNFLKGIAAGFGATVLPVPLAARPVVAVSTTGAAGFHYGWACVFAQRNNGISPADIAEKFRIPTSQANTLFDRMLDRGVLHPPGVDGRSHTTRTWQPWEKKTAPAPNPKHDEQKDARQLDRLNKAYRAMMASITGDPNAITIA